MKNSNLPFIVAPEKASNWVHALNCYSQCFAALKGIYPPSSSELIHGIHSMPTSWSLSLFYYSYVKYSSAVRVHSVVAAAALKRFQSFGNYNGMTKIFEDDIEKESKIGTQAAFLLASYAGLWEKALTLYVENPQLSHRSGVKKNLIRALCKQNLWETAFSIIYENGNSHFISPPLVRPLIRNLSHQHQHDKALRLAAGLFSAGYPMDKDILTSLILSLRLTGQWVEALRAAEHLRLLVPQSSQKNWNFSLLNSLVDCLYTSNLYSSYAAEDVVRDITERLQPQSSLSSSAVKRMPFRLFTYEEVQRKYFSVINSISLIYAKIIKVPFFARKNLFCIVEEIYNNNSVGVVLDTNFVMQCIAKNLAFEHFIPLIVRQQPELEKLNFNVIVIPFTCIQELHHLIWDPSNRMRHSVRVFLWSRLLTFLRQRNVFCLSFSSEYPCTFLSILARMAYKKVDLLSSTAFSSNPDTRILQVCLTLHHYIRCKEISALQGFTPKEGIMLFSFLKYHVRRFNNSAKGPTCTRLLLCTLDKSLSKAANEAGVLCFPNLEK